MLLKCAECGHDVSSSAKACPNCGAPVDVAIGQRVNTPAGIVADTSVQVASLSNPCSLCSIREATRDFKSTLYRHSKNAGYRSVWDELRITFPICDDCYRKLKLSNCVSCVVGANFLSGEAKLKKSNPIMATLWKDGWRPRDPGVPGNNSYRQYGPARASSALLKKLDEIFPPLHVT